MAVFLNVQSIVPQDNQTSKEFYFLLIFKTAIKFCLYSIKDLFMFQCFMKCIYIKYLYSTLYNSADIFSYFIKELFTEFLHFASILKTEKQTFV